MCFHGVDRENSLQIGCGPYRAYGVGLAPAASAEVRNTWSYTSTLTAWVASYVWDKNMQLL